MKGDESPQDDEVACSSIVWVLAGGYFCCTAAWKNKLKKVKDTWPKD